MVLEGDPALRNSTVLSLDAIADWDPTKASGVEQSAAAWGELLLPEIILARGKARQGVVEQLQDLLRRLPDEGVSVFRFRELVDALKGRVRHAWSAQWALLDGERGVEGHEGDELPTLVHLVRPDLGVEERDLLGKLTACVEKDLDGEYLLRLWDFLRAYAAEPGASLPSRRKLGELLSIPRNRLPQLLATLGDRLRRCRRATAGLAAVTVGKARSANPLEVHAMRRPPVSQDELRRETAATLVRLSALEEAPPTQLRPGDLVHLAATDPLPVEWLVVQIHSRQRRAWLVPADDGPAPGGEDIGVSQADFGAPLTLRCGFSVWVSQDDLAAGRFTGRVPTAALAAAQDRCRVLAAAGEDRVRGAEGASSADRQWVAEVLEPARRTLEERHLSLPAAPPKARRRARWRGFQMAAMLLFPLGLGLLGGAFWQQAGSRHLFIALADVAITVTTLRNGEPERQEANLSALADSVRLSINLKVEGAGHQQYELVIRKRGRRKAVWSGVVPVLDEQLRVVVPRDLLPAGTYRISIAGSDLGATAQQYAVEITVKYE